VHQGWRTVVEPEPLASQRRDQLRREHGRDVAMAVPGRRVVETTQVYAQIDRKRAMETTERVE
jgi:uncharacterized protein (DUF1499 family)